MRNNNSAASDTAARSETLPSAAPTAARAIFAGMTTITGKAGSCNIASNSAFHLAISPVRAHGPNIRLHAA